MNPPSIVLRAGCTVSPAGSEPITPSGRSGNSCETPNPTSTQVARLQHTEALCFIIYQDLGSNPMTHLNNDNDNEIILFRHKNRNNT